MLNLIIAQEEVIKLAGSQFEKLTNPILGILLIVLIALVLYLLRQLKAKDEYIRELHSNFSEHAMKNVEVLNNLEHSIKMDDESHRTIDALVRENNSFLKTLISKQS